MLSLSLLLLSAPVYCCAAAPQPSAECAVLMSEDGQIIYEKNGSKRALIASTTKLMTALVCLENSALTDEVEIKLEHCNVEGSSMYLKPGESYTVLELLQGLLLVSGNDAANALACHVSGSERAFVGLMNKKAAELGMKDTNFANPHGLNAQGHYSTARDMALLMAACVKNEEFIRICGAKSCTVAGQILVNHNRLLHSCPGCIAGKTGYTQAAGRCLVSCCEREGTRIICVTLSAPDDWNDHSRLYDWAFSNYSSREVTKNVSFTVPVVSGKETEAALVPKDSLKVFCDRNQEVALVAELPHFVFAPVNKGETGGKLWVIIEGRNVAQTELVYDKTVLPEAG